MAEVAERWGRGGANSYKSKKHGLLHIFLIPTRGSHYIPQELSIVQTILQNGFNGLQRMVLIWFQRGYLHHHPDAGFQHQVCSDGGVQAQCLGHWRSAQDQVSPSSEIT